MPFGNLSGLKCDCCGAVAPDVVGPLLIGERGWKEFTIDGVDDERGPWEAKILLCDDPHRGVVPGGLRRTGKGCASQMADFVAAGGEDGVGPPPPLVRTSLGGQQTEPEYRKRARRKAA